MVERTTRGDEEQKRTDESLTGQPTSETVAAAQAESGGTTTRDKGLKPADEKQGGAGRTQSGA